jgi:hypothetical protein
MNRLSNPAFQSDSLRSRLKATFGFKCLECEMSRDHILKVLRNGYEVPYPWELVYSDLLFLKDYRLNEFPMDGHGEFNTDYGEFDTDYQDWLQHYLCTCEICLTAEQIRIRDHISNNHNFSAASLGGIAGFYENSHALHPRYLFPDNFEDELDFDNLRDIIGDDPYEDYLDGFDDDDESDRLSNRLSKLDYILEDYGYYLLQSEEESQFREHWPTFIKIETLDWMFGCMEPNLELADSAWRVYLSFLLKAIPEKTARIEQLQSFFLSYADDLRK